MNLKTNIRKDQKEVLSSMKSNDNIVISKANKGGGEIVIQDKAFYLD